MTRQTPTRTVWWRVPLHVLAEARPAVQVAVLLRFTSAVALVPVSGTGHRFWWAALAWSAASVAIYVGNGLSDVAEDRINGSRRPIARGALTSRHALAGTMAAAATALIAGYVTDSTLGSLVLAYLVLGYAYSGPPWPLKRSTPATAVVLVGAGALTYGAGYVAGGGPHPTFELVVFAAAMTLWMALVGAVAKDLSDTSGDGAAGRRTSVIAWGEAKARSYLAVAAPAIGLASVVAGVWWPALLPVGTVLLAGSGILAGTAVRGLGTPDDRRPYRVFMVTQYVVHVTAIAAWW